MFNTIFRSVNINLIVLIYYQRDLFIEFLEVIVPQMSNIILSFDYLRAVLKRKNIKKNNQCVFSLRVTALSITAMSFILIDQTKYLSIVYFKYVIELLIVCSVNEMATTLSQLPNACGYVGSCKIVKRVYRLWAFSIYIKCRSRDVNVTILFYFDEELFCTFPVINGIRYI